MPSAASLHNVLPAQEGFTIEDPQESTRKTQKQNAATGASAASIRAVAAQFVAFYFRAPIKAFFRTRFDYTAYARAINPRFQSQQGQGRFSWRTSTPGLLVHAVKEHGWGFLPAQVIPPMLANVTVGAILYTTYLQSLGRLYDPASRQSQRIFPPPPVPSAFGAGFVAGSVQSIVASPLDALQARYKSNDFLEGQYNSIWQYAKHKLKEIGPRGVLAGWGLSFVKDSLGYACFFATFEGVKSQAQYHFIRQWYGKCRPIFARDDDRPSSTSYSKGRPTIRPHYAIEPTFLLLAGVSASIVQQVIQHPISTIQNLHYGRLESLDYAARLEKSSKNMLRLYYHAYAATFDQCRRQATRAGSWGSWLYKDLISTAIRQVPSTSAGLIVFELVRRRYSINEDVVRIHKDGYDILLP